MTPRANTKIERVVEGIEDLSVAVIAAHSTKPPTGAYENVQNARKELRDALAEFITPTLRVVQ